MSIINCPSCGGRTPATGISCVHCGTLAPSCGTCSGSGVCRRCQNAYPQVAGCEHCGQTGRFAKCDGRKRAWDVKPPPGGR